MSIFSRDQVPLSDAEICLVKGLLNQRSLLGLNQQRIIALFSYPQRTVHHNVVSAIARGNAGTSDAVYPPASLVACERFLDLWTGDWADQIWATEFSSSYDPRMNHLSFSYRYHPVGQGLFCSGQFVHPDGNPFRWVYDCGTERGARSQKRADHVRMEIAELQRNQTHNHLDLVTLSHFDEDHLSGILDLLATFTVGTLLLPYLTPWERLIVALSEATEVDTDLLNFLIAPTAFLLERAGGRIDRILLVPPSGEGPALPPLFPPDEPPLEEETIEWRSETLFKDQKPDGEDEDEAGVADKGLLNPKVRVLQRGGWIVVAHAWEFVPYNDTRLEALATSTFKTSARPLADKLVNSISVSERKVALDALIQLYDQTFKTKGSASISARRRNEISLYLYAGPLGRVELIEAQVTIPRHAMDTWPGTVPKRWIHTHRFGQMLTGDGFLHTAKKLKDFESFYARGHRLERAGIFQVMHHGSEANWQPGFAAKIAPVASLFCSDPLGTYGHPDNKVIADFSSFHPVQIDGVHGWMVEGVYRFL